MEGKSDSRYRLEEEAVWYGEIDLEGSAFWRESGATRAKPQGGDKRSQRIEACREAILAAIDDQDDITLVELAEFLKAEHAAVFAPSTIWRFLDRHSMALKKTAHTSEQDRPDVLTRRRTRFKAQPDLDSERLVFIDKTGASTKMARVRGRTKRGALPICDPALAPGEWFAAYAEQALAPTLRAGDILILTTCHLTKSPLPAKPSKQRAHGCSSFLPAAPSSTRSRTPSPH